MALPQTATLKPRKTPVQARSAVTVDAIYDAAIQVLLTQGAKRTTTIRVAERAGVSVGTLYQYHSNIESLMASVIERHLTFVLDTVEKVCRANHNQPAEAMLKAFVNAFIDAKTAHMDASRALYEVSLDLNCRSLVQNASTRGAKVLQTMLATATDCDIKDVKVVARMIVAIMPGAIRALVEMNASRMMIDEVRRHLSLLCAGYVKELSCL